MKNQDYRKKQFGKWWYKNKNHKPAHKWLAHHARERARFWRFHPQTEDEINFITKRYFQSTHKRLSKADAWKLFRIVNPLPHQRLKQIQAEADYLKETLEELKAESMRQKKEEDKKTRITVKKKRTYTL